MTDRSVIPANAGTRLSIVRSAQALEMGPRFRGDDEGMRGDRGVVL